MYDVMAGVRVIEVAEMLMGPSAAMTLADWGADVIKVERAGVGDRARSMAALNSAGWNHNNEIANRGKRSIALELGTPEGREILAELIKTADVFITNFRLKAQQKLKITAEDVTALNPRIIYAWASGHGPTGPLAELPGFDWPSSWCRSGAAFIQTPPGGEPPNQPASVGDLIGGLSTAGAISAALFRRERTGKGCVISNSLYQTGIYVMSQSITLGAAKGPDRPDMPLYARRDQAFSPLVYAYKTKDDRWIALCILLPEWWPDLTRHLKRPDLLEDQRFATEASRQENMKVLIAELQKVFLTKTFEEWKNTFSTLQGVWAPLASPDEVARDEHALLNGYVTPVTQPDGNTFLSASTPGQFDQRPIGHLRSAPNLGEHTDEVLRDLGIPSDKIAALRQAGRIS